MSRAAWVLRLAAVGIAAAVLTSDSLAIERRGRRSSESKTGKSLYDRGIAAAERGSCAEALPLFERAAAKIPRDPDVLNMLAYCQRQTGRVEEAFENYRRALELRPRFPQAREYLGEAHLKAALEQLEILRSYGDAARKERRLLETALREAADEVSASTDEVSAPIPDGRW